jgi:hypothetical protein
MSGVGNVLRRIASRAPADHRGRFLSVSTSKARTLFGDFSGDDRWQILLHPTMPDATSLPFKAPRSRCSWVHHDTSIGAGRSASSEKASAVGPEPASVAPGFPAGTFAHPAPRTPPRDTATTTKYLELNAFLLPVDFEVIVSSRKMGQGTPEERP